MRYLLVPIVWLPRARWRCAECGTSCRGRYPVIESMTCLAFAVVTFALSRTGIVGIAVIVGSRGGRKTASPFGPFMFSAAILALFLPQPIVSSYRQFNGG